MLLWRKGLRAVRNGIRGHKRHGKKLQASTSGLSLGGAQGVTSQ